MVNKLQPSTRVSKSTTSSKLGYFLKTMLKIYSSSLLSLLAFSSALAQDAPPDLSNSARLERLIAALERGGIPKGQTTISVYFPPRKNTTQSAGKLPRLVLVPNLVRQNFELSVLGSEKILGRDVDKLELKPKVEGAATWNFWVDVQWGVPLALEQRSFDGQVMGHAEYTTLKAQKMLPRPNPSTPLTVRSGLERKIKDTLPNFAPPQGFRAVSLKRGKRGDLQTLELTYSDGLNTFPLILAAKGTKAADGIAVRKLGAKNGEIWLWMVGRFPKNTLEGTLATVQGPVDVEGLGTFADTPPSNP